MAVSVDTPAFLAVADNSADYRRLRHSLTQRLAESLNLPPGGTLEPHDVQRAAHAARDAVASSTIAPETREQLTRDLINELTGFGPIQPLLDDVSVTEIMVNRANRIYVERGGKPVLTPICFDDDDHVIRIIRRIIEPIGRMIDAENPLVDARLPDGSRLHAAIAPVMIDGPVLTIRKFSRSKLQAEDLIDYGTITAPVADFLKACVVARLNIIVSGGTGSGKTTLLNVLTGFIPDDERIITIEDAAELRLNQEHVVRMESKNARRDGKGEISIRELVRNALRMRPDRIIVGECRGGETLDMLQAMNTGHDGSLTTLHANSPRDAISRIETMSLMGGIDFPIKVIREQMASAVDLIIQQARMRDGSRKVTWITEIVGMEGEKMVLQDLFRFDDQPTNGKGKVEGNLRPVGQRPQFSPKLEAAGFKLPPELFVSAGFSSFNRR